MSTTTLTGLLLIVLPIIFNTSFALLGLSFDYPGILRRPTSEVLTRFRQGGSSLVFLWWSFALSALLFAPLVVLLSRSIADVDATLLAVATTIGVLASVVQFLGLVRWPFLVPYLARTAAEPDASEARREAVDVVFQSFNRYLGVGVGEHLGYLLTGAWSVLAGAALRQTVEVPSWLGVAGIVVGAVLMLCSLEFVAGFEPTGWKLAGDVVPFAYIAWSLWLIATGVALIA